MNIRSFSLSILILLAISFSPTFCLAKDDPIYSVRILIDVSGSMKKNDPHNLRAPAMRMLVNLLPKGSNAGVWTFAKYSNQLVGYSKVTPWWQKHAIKKSHSIGSPGQFTDIATVLLKSRSGWETSSDKEKRSILLLTDGVVDVSKNPEDSEKSRNEIINNIIPQLRKSKINVHTIALSKNADIELMKKISLETDGVFKMADSADQLQRIFLHLFEKSVKRDTLPLKGNKFTVDSSVNELTLLVFKNSQSETTKIIAPDKTEFTKKVKPKKTSWHSESGYDLITIRKPIKGEWKIIADVDPDNRVMIVTDLKLRTTELPNNIINGESFDFFVNLAENGQTIDRSEFHNFLSVNVTQSFPSKNTQEWIVEDHGLAVDKKAKDGIYSLRFSKTLREEGTHEITTFIDGRTFQRQLKQQMVVHNIPLSIESKEYLNEDSPGYKVFCRITQNWINTDSVKIIAEVIQPDGLSEIMSLEKIDDAWVLDIKEIQYDRKYSIKIQMKGLTNTEREINVRNPIIDLIYKSPTPKKKEQEPETKPAPEIKEEKPNWAIIIGAIAGFNIFIVVVIVIIYILSKRGDKNIPTLEEDEEAEEDKGEDEVKSKEEGEGEDETKSEGESDDES